MKIKVTVDYSVSGKIHKKPIKLLIFQGSRLDDPNIGMEVKRYTSMLCNFTVCVLSLFKK